MMSVGKSNQLNARRSASFFSWFRPNRRHAPASARRIAGREALVGADHDIVLIVFDPVTLLVHRMLGFFNHWELQIQASRPSAAIHRFVNLRLERPVPCPWNMAVGGCARLLLGSGWSIKRQLNVAGGDLRSRTLGNPAESHERRVPSARPRYLTILPVRQVACLGATPVGGGEHHVFLGLACHETVTV
jgi:hypothetical protein